MTYSTFVGGSGNDFARALAVDGSGAAYLIGETRTERPATRPRPAPSTRPTTAAVDAFVTKLNPAGTALAYSTFLGGSGADSGNSIAVGGDGSAYVTGQTSDAATDYPTTGGAFDTTHNGSFDVFVTKLNPAGSALTYSTFLGGSGADFAFGIAVGGDGSAYVTGQTVDAATDYPATSGSFDLTPQRRATTPSRPRSTPPAARSPTRPSSAARATTPGAGSRSAPPAAPTSPATRRTPGPTTRPPPAPSTRRTTACTDAFATKLNPAGSALSYSTFLGGAGTDAGGGIAVDGSGAAYVTGNTADAATDYPTTAGAFDPTQNGFNDAFATKLNATGGALPYSTFLGGSGNDEWAERSPSTAPAPPT